jgi:hypothetical protein
VGEDVRELHEGLDPGGAARREDRIEVRGEYFRLYLVLDIWSRKIMGIDLTQPRDPVAAFTAAEGGC